MTGSILADIGIIAFIAFSGWRGYREGFFVATANLIGLVLSLLLAFWLYEPLAGWLLDVWTIPVGLMNIFAFLLIAFIADGIITAAVLIGSNYLGKQLLQAPFIHWAGVVPGLANGIITTAYLVAIVSGMPLEHPLKVAVTNAAAAQPLIEFSRSTKLPIDSLIEPAIHDISQLFTISPDSDEMVELGFSVANPQVASTAEEQMLALVNQEREKAGVGLLVMDAQLRELARAHSLDMYQRGYFSHYTPEGKDPFDRMRERNISYLAAGENLALAPSVDMAHTGLMNSPGHKRNILDPKYTKVGIGSYQDSRYGIMFSQEFTN